MDRDVQAAISELKSQVSSLIGYNANLTQTPSNTKVSEVFLGLTFLNGQLVLAQQSSVNVPLVNGANENIALPSGLVFALVGPTAAFNIGGFQGGVDGRVIVVMQNTSHQITVKNASAGSAAVNRIAIPSLGGGNLVGNAGGTDVFLFCYFASYPAWFMIAHN